MFLQTHLRSISGLPCSGFLSLLQRSNKWLLGHFTAFPLLEGSQSLLNSFPQVCHSAPFSTHTEQAVRFPNLSAEHNPKFSSLSYKRQDMKQIPMLKSSHDISKQVKTIIVRFLACNKADGEHWKIQGSKRPNSHAGAVQEGTMNSEEQQTSTLVFQTGWGGDWC